MADPNLLHPNVGTEIHAFRVFTLSSQHSCLIGCTPKPMDRSTHRVSVGKFYTHTRSAQCPITDRGRGYPSRATASTGRKRCARHMYLTLGRGESHLGDMCAFGIDVPQHVLPPASHRDVVGV